MFNPFGSKKNNPAHSLEQPRNNGMSDGELSALKAFFFECRGDGMSMHRCDAERYERYCLVDKDTVQQWRIELIEVKLAALTSDRDDPRWNDNWQVVENIERLISFSNVPKEAYYKVWLDKIVEILPSLDKMQRILILEHFAGRNESQKDGAIYKIHTSTSLDGQMKEVIALLCDFACDESDNSEFLGWQDVPRRFASAKEDILRAYEKFGIE